MTLRKSGKLRFVGVLGEVKVRWHRALPSVPKSAILTRQAGKWFVVFHVEVASVERASPDSVGLDFGLTALAALSNGDFVDRSNFTKRHAKALRRSQRAFARCDRGSNNRRKRKAAVAKLHAHIGNARRDYLHKESRKLVNRFGRIAVEDLNVKGLAGGMLAKHVTDASWAQLISFLAYKAESAGCELVIVDPEEQAKPALCAGLSPKRRLPSACTAAIADVFSTVTSLRQWLYTSEPSVSGPVRALGR